jgi:hypothetical protein
MDKDLEKFFRQAQDVRLHAAEKEALRPHPEMSVVGDSVRGPTSECQNGHMTWSFDRFLTASQTLRLTERERSESFERVLAFMQEHPIAVQWIEDQTASSRGIFSHGTWASLFSSLRLMPALALAFLLLIGSGITSVAAEGALPGDTLYPVKIHVNENVRKAFAGSAEAEARMESELVTRRLQEARELTARGDMSAEVQQTIATAIARQVSAAREKVATLTLADELDTAADVSAELEAAVKAHHNVFARLAQNNDTSVDVILSALVNADTASAQTQADFQAKVSAVSSGALQAIAERGIAAAQRQTESVRQMLEKQKSELSVHARGEMEARLKVAQDAIAHAQARLQAGATAQALNSAAEANTAAHESRALGTVQKLLVEVKATGGETVVEIKTDNANQPKVDVRGGGAARVRINGKEVTTSAGMAASSASSLASASSQPTKAETSIKINQQTTSEGTTTTTESHTNVNTSTNVQVQGGTSVQIHQSAGVNVNNSVKIGQ